MSLLVYICVRFRLASCVGVRRLRRVLAGREINNMCLQRAARGACFVRPCMTQSHVAEEAGDVFTCHLLRLSYMYNMAKPTPR